MRWNGILASLPFSNWKTFLHRALDYWLHTRKKGFVVVLIMNYIKGSKGSCLTIIILIYLHDDQKPENPSKHYITGFSIYHQQMLWKLQKALLLQLHCYFDGRLSHFLFTFCDQWRQKSIVVSFSVLQRNYWLLGDGVPLGLEDKDTAVATLPLKSLERQFFTQNFSIAEAETLLHNNTIV